MRYYYSELKHSYRGPATSEIAYTYEILGTLETTIYHHNTDAIESAAASLELLALTIFRTAQTLRATSVTPRGFMGDNPSDYTDVKRDAQILRDRSDIHPGTVGEYPPF